jgi:hypothetical protein
LLLDPMLGETLPKLHRADWACAYPSRLSSSQRPVVPL